LTLTIAFVLTLQPEKIRIQPSDPLLRN